MEQQINYNEFLAQVAVDWNGLQLSAVVPNERAMQGVQAEKKVAVARELREDRPETKGIALLRSTDALAQAEAAAEPEEGYQEDQKKKPLVRGEPLGKGFHWSRHLTASDERFRLGSG